jgi:hypothetical protein
MGAEADALCAQGERSPERVNIRKRLTGADARHASYGGSSFAIPMRTIRVSPAPAPFFAAGRSTSCRRC